MSYNLCSTNLFLQDATAPTNATSQPEFFAQGRSLRQINNTSENNIAEKASNNLNHAVTISIADLQAI